MVQDGCTVKVGEVFWNQDYVFCIWYLVTCLCMDGAKDKVEQVRRVQRQSRQEIGTELVTSFLVIYNQLI